MVDDLLTIREVADLLGLCEATVRRHVHGGGLPAVRLSARSWRIRRSDLTAWLARRAA